MAFAGIDSVTLTGTTPLRLQNDGDQSQQDRFQVLDKAGNTVAAVFEVKTDDGRTQFSLSSLSYNNAAALTATPNSIQCEGEREQEDGSLSELKQHLRLPSQGIAVDAQFEAEENQTANTIAGPGQPKRIVRRGLVFLSITTKDGALGFEF